MKTMKKLSNNKNTYITTVAAIISAVFCALGSEAAFCNWIPDISQFLPKAADIAISSLIFPVSVVVTSVVVKNARMKLASILYIKLILEIIILPFGVNLNTPAEFFDGDFASLFFIFVDALLLLEVVNKESDEKIISGVSFAVISVVLMFSLLLNYDLAIFFRMLYIITFYGLCFFLSMKSPESFFDSNYPSSKEEMKQLAKEKLLLVLILLFTALSSLATYLLVSALTNRSLIPIDITTAKLICFSCWVILCLDIAALFSVYFKKHSTLHLVVAAILVAITATLVVIAINSYSYCLIYNYYNPDEWLGYVYFLSQEIGHIINYHGVFASTLVFSFLTTRYINKNNLSLFDDIECDSDDEKASLHIDAGKTLCSLANAFAESNNKTSPFIVASSYENNNVQVVVGASDEELMEMIRFMIYASAMRLKSDDIDIGEAYETLTSYVSGALYNAYNTDPASDSEFDINNYLEGD